MAIAPVQVIDPVQEFEHKKAKKGGGKMGQAVGGVIGGVIGAVGGGPGGAIAGASSGASVGGMIGERISPSREASSKAIERRIAASRPQVSENDNTEKLKQSIMALHSQPSHVREEYGPPLIEAYVESIKQREANSRRLA